MPNNKTKRPPNKGRCSELKWALLKEFLSLALGSAPLFTRAVMCLLLSATDTTPLDQQVALSSDVSVCGIVIPGLALLSLFPGKPTLRARPSSVMQAILLLALLAVMIASAILYALIGSGGVQNATSTSIWLYGTAVTASLILAIDRAIRPRRTERKSKPKPPPGDQSSET
jgi:Ca2+/H+ antiporter